MIEERYFRRYGKLNPMLVTGTEGVAGFSLWLILIPAFQFIPCSNPTVCSGGVIEDSLGALRDYQANPILILYSVLLVIIVPFLNITGMSVTKYGSAAQRTTGDLVRNLFVWLFFMFVPL